MVDAACVARTISGMPASLPAPERVERRRAITVRREGWYEDGDWYEPLERRSTNGSQPLELR
jgi:hypothetical protein